MVYFSGMDHATKEAFTKLTETVERGFAAVAEDIADIRARMATKDDLKELATKAELRAFREETAQNFRDLREEVRDLRRAIEDLRTRVANIEGYSKEIDYLMQRVRAIEKHLGIEPKIAA
jgi:predicted  nucleic acid-binding Zn-ribbon protein